jgi:hypothetical protein
MLEKKMDPNIVDEDGNNLLFNCYSKMNVSLLLKAGTNINHRNLEGKNALHYTYPRIFRYLVNNGITSTVEDRYNLIVEGKLREAKILIDQDPDMRDELGQTILFKVYAEDCATEEILQLMTNVDRSIPDKYGTLIDDL